MIPNKTYFSVLFYFKYTFLIIIYYLAVCSKNTHEILAAFKPELSIFHCFFSGHTLQIYFFSFSGRIQLFKKLAKSHYCFGSPSKFNILVMHRIFIGRSIVPALVENKKNVLFSFTLLSHLPI